MNDSFPKADQVEIMILAEGTYPYIRGGVSSWIHQLISHLPQFTFGICFLGSRPEDYGEIRYQLPENLIHLEVHYLFGESGRERGRVREIPDAPERLESLHKALASPHGTLPASLRSATFFREEFTEGFFLHSQGAWEYINRRYLEHAPDIPFIDYFWTIRNIHRPIWTLASIAARLPRCGLFHSPSTGYAGFLGALASYQQGVPFFLTEHGIYTRERKIDLLQADWISYRKPTLLRQPEEFNVIKETWIDFFSRIGLFAYRRARHVFSLFPQAREIQLRFGAEASKCEVIPNGVNVDRLGEALARRPEEVPPVITLIGRVVSIKDIKTFIRAMRIVVSRLPEAEGWIVGPLDEDELYVEECRQMVQALDLERNVRFLGFQNILDILPQTGIQTLTSISEGMPLVILEGFAAGVPCVATDVGSCRDLIEGGLDDADRAIGSAGAVTEIANPSQLAREYLDLLTDRERWQAAQKAALERVHRYYREELFLQRYSDHYRKALHGGHRL